MTDEEDLTPALSDGAITFLSVVDALEARASLRSNPPNLHYFEWGVVASLLRIIGTIVKSVQRA